MNGMRRIGLVSIVSLLALTTLAPAARSADILVDYYCVTDDAFYFGVEMIDLPSGTAILRIATQGDAFSAPHERLALNFDVDSGDITHGPIVETNGVVMLDYWMDGGIADFDLVSIGPGAYRFTGSILHGANPYDPDEPGNVIAQTVLRPPGGGGDIFADAADIGDCRPDFGSVIYCVDTDASQIGIVLHNAPPVGTHVVRVGSNGDPFSSNVERFSFNWDTALEETTYGPIVETFGSPSTDRWMDGAPLNFGALVEVVGPFQTLSFNVMMENEADALLHGATLPSVVWRIAGGGELSLANLPVINCRGTGPTAELTLSCAAEGQFRFSIDLAHLPAGEMVLRVGAENDPFVGPTERIAVNFDAATGAILAGPSVDVVGMARDVWQDGILFDSSMTKLGTGAWRFEGTILNGTEPLTAGETVDMLRLRTFVFPEVAEADLPVTDCGVANSTTSWGSLKGMYGRD